MNWETFIYLNCLLKFYSSPNEEYIQFFVNLIDHFNKGMVPKEEYAVAVDSLFKEQFAGDEDVGESSLANDVKRMFQQVGIINLETGELDI